MESDLDVRSEARGTSLMITATGEIDLATVGRLEAALSVALNLVPEIVVIDLSGVTFVDSTGIHRLIVAHRRATEQGIRLAIIPGPECVQRTFAVCGLDDELPFVPAVPSRGAWAA
jgi:anti-anti-sigma factor